MLNDFLQPLSESFLQQHYHSQPYVKNHIQLYQHTQSTEGYRLALLGIQDYRGYIANKGTEHAADALRRQLYTLSAFTNGMQLLDMGNIAAGETYVDTLVALVETLHDLFKRNIICILIGGDVGIASAQFKAYEIFENPQNVSHITADVKWEDSDVDIYNTYIKDFFLSNYLNNYNLVAYQSYFMHDKQISFLNNRQYDMLRVGKIREFIQEAEPYLREAEMVIYDINAIRHSDAPGQPNPSPNGLFGDEACALARYSGMSDLLMSIGFYNYNPNLDVAHITAKQMAQMIWYFMEGISLRRGDYPILSENDFNHYYVTIENAENDFIFLKSKKSDRWWMKILYDKMDKQKHKLLPCTYKDYLTALNNEIPERWMREWLRLT